MIPYSNLVKRIGVVAILGALVSCGGGGNATGGLTEFSVTPDTWKLTFGKGNTVCAVDPSNLPFTVVTVIGGAPPYRIVNSSPQWLSVSTSVLDGKSPSFKVFAIGGCGDSMSVLILDSLSRSVNFKATFEAGEELTADPATTP